jgi:hypothetical protein
MIKDLKDVEEGQVVMIIYDDPYGQRYLFRITDIEINRTLGGYYENILVYDMLQDKFVTLPMQKVRAALKNGIQI